MADRGACRTFDENGRLCSMYLAQNRAHSRGMNHVFLVSYGAAMFFYRGSMTQSPPENCAFIAVINDYAFGNDDNCGRLWLSSFVVAGVMNRLTDDVVVCPLHVQWRI